MKSEKTHVFGFVTSLLFTVFTVGGFSLVLYVKYDIVDLETTIYSGMLLFLASFLVLQQRIKRFIYKRVRKIYEDVSLLETSSFNEDSMTADIETLSIEVQKFATDKQLEIESLNEREAYRREFLGNVSHELKTPLFTVQGYLLTLIEGAANDEGSPKPVFGESQSRSRTPCGDRQRFGPDFQIGNQRTAFGHQTFQLFGDGSKSL